MLTSHATMGMSQLSHPYELWDSGFIVILFPVRHLALKAKHFSVKAKQPHISCLTICRPRNVLLELGEEVSEEEAESSISSLLMLFPSSLKLRNKADSIFQVSPGIGVSASEGAYGSCIIDNGASMTVPVAATGELPLSTVPPECGA